MPHCTELAERLRPYRPEVICGPLTGGAYVAQLVAVALDAEFCWTAGPGYDLAAPLDLAGRRAAVVDDAVNAGHATSATAASLVTSGATVVAVAALLTLTDAPPTVAGAPVLSLATLRSSRWPAATCPLCATGSPLDAPLD